MLIKNDYKEKRRAKHTFGVLRPQHPKPTPRDLAKTTPKTPGSRETHL